MKKNAQNDIKSQMKAGEMVLGNDIACNPPNTTEDVKLNALQPKTVTTAHVTVSVSCKATVFDPKDAQRTAEDLLKQKAMKDLGEAYALAGHIITQPPQPQKQQNGSTIFPVTASGVWYRQWTDIMKQTLSEKIKGKSKAEAQTILNKYLGISNATIEISNDGNTLPSDVSQIRLDVKVPNGL